VVLPRIPAGGCELAYTPPGPGAGPLEPLGRRPLEVLAEVLEVAGGLEVLEVLEVLTSHSVTEVSTDRIWLSAARRATLTAWTPGQPSLPTGDVCGIVRGQRHFS
jgi:hypothetical protein